MKTSSSIRKFMITGSLMAGVLFAGQAMAQVDGVYKSDGGDDCTLTITPINIEPPQFGDGYFRMESRGKAACMWDGVGMSQSTNLVGSYITLPPVFNRVYLTVKWLFGPTSPKIEMIQRNEQGEVLLTATYTRQ